jgi:hypothetical protein
MRKKEVHPMVQEAKDRNVHKGHEDAFTPAPSGVIIKEVSEEAPNEASKALAVVKNSTDIAFHADKTFTTSARQSMSLMPQHKITWFTGNSECTTTDGEPLPRIRGFAIEQPNGECISPEDDALYEAMRCLCQDGRAREVIVEQHDGRKVRYWALTKGASLFVLCQGVPTVEEMLGRFERGRPSIAEQMSRLGLFRWGVAYAWPDGLDEQGRRKTSKVAFVAFIKELMEAQETREDRTVMDYPYLSPFIFHFQSFCTDRIIKTLRSHDRILNYANRHRGPSRPLPYYAYALPIGCSKEPLIAGKGTDTSKVFYPVPLHPQRITEEHLASMAITDWQAEIAEADGNAERASDWSIEKSRRMLLGRDSDDLAEEDSVSREPTSVDDDRPF